MKKTLLFLAAIFMMVSTAKATEIWTGSCTIGNWGGSSVTVDKDAFSSAEAGNVIKVTISAYAETESDNTTPVTYWQYSLGQKDNGWAGLTDFSGGDLTKGQTSATYTLTETNVTELKTYGLAVNGRYITVTKVELLTTTSESLWTGSVSTGNWGSETTDMVALSYDDKGELANAQMNDYVQVTYTVTASGAQVGIQNPNGWTNIAIKDDDSYDEGGTNTGKTFTLTIDDATTLEIIQQNGILVRGKYITITAVDLIKPSNRYDAVPLTIGDGGIATFGSSKNLDFSDFTDVAVPYYVSAKERGKVTLTSVTTTRTWVGYIVKGTPGTYSIPVTATEPEWNDNFNYLRYAGDYNGNTVYRSVYSDYSGGGDDETKIKTYYRYIFAKHTNGDETETGFFKLEGNDHTLAAHKAYLETEDDITPIAGTRGLELDFGDGTTAILPIEIENDRMSEFTPREDGVYYTLQGTRVQSPTKGLYILNGKKVLVK